MLGVLGSSGSWQQEGGKERSGAGRGSRQHRTGGQHPQQAQPHAERCRQSLTRLSPGGAGPEGAAPGSTAAPAGRPRHQTHAGCFPGSPRPGDPAVGTAHRCHPKRLRLRPAVAPTGEGHRRQRPSSQPCPRAAAPGGSCTNLGHRRGIACPVPCLLCATHPVHTGPCAPSPASTPATPRSQPASCRQPLARTTYR